MYTDTLRGKKAVSSSNNLVALRLVNEVLKVFAFIVMNIDLLLCHI